jgi:hypothetical protein
MKKNQPLQFIFISIFIYGFLISAVSYGNNNEGFFKSQMGMFSLNGETYFHPRGIAEPQKGTGFFENSKDPQKVTLHTKRAVRKLDETIFAMLSSSDPETVADGQHLQSLAYDLNPTLYLQDGDLKNPSGEMPYCAESDATSVSKLYKDNSQFSQVELITIRLNQASELATIVNTANFQNFPDLKYILILCSFEICSSPGCEASTISQIVQVAENSNFLILYQISIPE